MKNNTTCSLIVLVLSLIYGIGLRAQTVQGTVRGDGEPLSYASVYLQDNSGGASADEEGRYVLANLAPGTYVLVAEFVGFLPQKKRIKLEEGSDLKVDFSLQADDSLDEIVISGTLKPVSKSESVVPVEIYNPTFFKKNPVPNLFDAVQMINGVQPQLNCNVCNTGDIHINGMEGPYTMILIDGMPIVSSLASVYGLSGIPTSMIERVEVVKGPASSLYGTEAMGGESSM